MRYCLLLLTLLANALYGQETSSAVLEIKNLRYVKIELERKKHPEKETLFSAIAIKDLRPDTLTNGYVKFAQEFKKYFRLEFNGGVQSAASFLNSYYNTKGCTHQRRLLLLLTNLFITQDYKMPSTGVNLVNDVYTSKAYVAAAFVSEEGGKRYLLGNVDTVLTLNKWLGKSYNTMAKTAFATLVETAEAYLSERPPAELDEASFQEISRVLVPPPATLQDGFYATYEAFLKGQKIDLKIRFSEVKNTRVLQASSAGDSAFFNRSWGFVDGGLLFVRHQNTFIPLQYTFGSWSGLGMDSYEVYKLPAFYMPLSFAVDLIDITVNGPTRQYTPFKLYKLNGQTGRLE